MKGNMVSFKRADRVAEQIMAEISEIIFKEVKDPRVHALTITAVKVSNAKIFFVEMGQDECSAEMRAGLDRATNFVRKELGRRMQLRFIPQISFIHDQSFGYGSRIDKILANIAQADGKND